MTHGVSLLLISAAAGYWVLTQASKERDRVKKLGQMLGLAIIVASVVGIGCKLYFVGKMKGSCPSVAACPFVKSAPPDSGK